MVPFVLAQPSRSDFTAVPSETLEPKLQRDLAFFRDRGIDLRTDNQPMMTGSPLPTRR